MKKIFLFALVPFFFAGCINDTDAKSANPSADANTGSNESFTTIQWIDSSKNLGKINEGQILNISFRFKNTGDKPLVIRSVQPGCGCTVADYPKKPIPPGEGGEITGAFDSNGREGMNKKSITVNANTKDLQNHTLHFEVEVIKKKT